MGPKRKTAKESPLPSKRVRTQPAYDDYVVDSIVKSPARGKAAAAAKPSKASTSSKAAESPLPTAPAPSKAKASRKAPSSPAPAPAPKPAPAATATATATATTSRRSARSGPTVSAPEPLSTAGETDEPSSTSSASSTQISVGDLWGEQVYGALASAIFVVVVVFAVHFAHDVYKGKQTLEDAPKMVSSLGFVLMWVVGAILLPFLATSLVVLVVSTTNGSPAMQGLLAASAVAVAGVVVVHREKIF